MRVCLGMSEYLCLTSLLATSGHKVSKGLAAL